MKKKIAQKSKDFAVERVKREPEGCHERCIRKARRFRGFLATGERLEAEEHRLQGGARRLTGEEPAACSRWVVAVRARGRPVCGG